MARFPLRAAWHAGAIALMLLGTSCASDHDFAVKNSPDVNHPIEVAPTMAKLDLAFATPAAGLMPQDEARLRRFVQHYLADGNGAISLVVPAGSTAADTVHYFGEQLTALGIAPARILVGTDPSASRVALSFITYRADVAPCGSWDDIAKTGDNLPMENLGCATQHNLAAMVADPRDLLAPRPMDAADATERNDRMQKYEAGQPTPAAQVAGQSVKVSGVGSN